MLRAPSGSGTPPAARVRHGCDARPPQRSADRTQPS